MNTGCDMPRPAIMPARATPKGSFAVWAPKATTVEVVFADGRRVPLIRDGEFFRDSFRDGEHDLLDLPAGTRYGLSVDGSAPVADPRSRRQPDGPHGLSEVWYSNQDIEPALLTPLGRPLQGEVLYELHLGTFTPEGTFDAAIGRLDYLAGLGVTAVELMPVQPFGGQRNWGYDGVCWHAVSEVYGGPNGLARFVAAAHTRGIAVVLDVVFNHFGPDGNYTGMFGPYTAGGSTGWGEVVNLQGAGSDYVREYILDAVRQWTRDFGIDGLRLDAVHAFDDTGAVSLLEQIRDVASPSWVIAESDQNDPRLTEDFCIAQWNDDIHHAIHTWVSGENHTYYADFGSTETLAATLRHVFWHDGRYSSFRGRTHGRPVRQDTTHPERWRFITYTTTHDQTGNRAAGDRPSMNLSPQQQIAKAALVLVSPYTPMLFMGEEWGAATPFAFFVDHESEQLRTATRQGRLREFARAGWDPEEVPDPAAEETFLSSKLDWSELEQPAHAELLATYRELLDFRRQHRLAEARILRVDWSEGDTGGRWIEVELESPVATVTLRVEASDRPSGWLTSWSAVSV